MSGLPTTAARERAADTLRHVGLYEERYRPIGGYSTGMRQRVKLAQALVHDPALVLLDEPTNGLDPAGRDDMLELIRRIGAEFGISVIVTSHLLGELERVCEGIVVIDAGRLLRHSTTASVTAETQLVTIEVDEGAAVLHERLPRLRPRRAVDGQMLHVDVDDPTVYDLLRDAVAELGLGLVRLERAAAPDDRDLHGQHTVNRGPRMSERAGRGANGRHPRHRLPALRRAPAGRVVHPATRCSSRPCAAPTDSAVPPAPR